MQIYNYDRGTGVLLSETEARPDPLTPGSFLVPAFATLLVPPEADGDRVPIFTGSAWVLEYDYIGAEVYSTETALRVYITELGPLPEGTTLLKPPDTYPKWDGSKWVDDVEQAAADKIKSLEAFCDEKQQEHFYWQGHYFYADSSAQNDFSKTLQRCSRLSDETPVPTPAPITGKWKTAEVADGLPVFVDMTVGQLRDFSDALYDHIAALWAIKDAHKLVIQQMVLGGASSAQIIAHDITTGW